MVRLPNPIVVGCSTVVHLGWSVEADYSLRSDKCARTLCGKDWRLAGPVKVVNRDPTCPGCIAAMGQRKARAA